MDFDRAGLIERQHFYRLIDANLEKANSRIDILTDENEKQHEHIEKLSDAYNKIYKNKRLFSLLTFSIKTYIRNRLPGLQKFIKRISGKA